MEIKKHAITMTLQIPRAMVKNKVSKKDGVGMFFGILLRELTSAMIKFGKNTHKENKLINSLLRGTTYQSEPPCKNDLIRYQKDCLVMLNSPCTIIKDQSNTKYRSLLGVSCIISTHPPLDIPFSANRKISIKE
ncbi:Uncharacterised protein [Moraxella ovis]|nr:Uncharacterised protein [Moraxella ovis]STZ06523.1 Uncharacterised protein [Moraxella ovis]